MVCPMTEGNILNALESPFTDHVAKTNLRDD